MSPTTGNPKSQMNVFINFHFGLQIIIIIIIIVI
jgi:hypothetical protein